MIDRGMSEIGGELPDLALEQPAERQQVGGRRRRAW